MKDDINHVVCMGIKPLHEQSLNEFSYCSLMLLYNHIGCMSNWFNAEMPIERGSTVVTPSSYVLLLLQLLSHLNSDFLAGNLKAKCEL